MTESPRIGVVMLTFDPAPGMLESAVRSVLDAAGVDDAEVSSDSIRFVVVDNGSGAHTRLADAGLDAVEVLVASHNGGYSAGMNLGIRHVLSEGVDAVALLNDDVEVEVGWLGPLIAEIDGDPFVAAAQPTLLSRSSGGVTIDGAGVVVDRFGAGSDRFRGAVESVAGPTPTDIDAFTGGAVLIRREFLEQVGLLDERFFLYYEDVELARRRRMVPTAWRYRHVPASRVWHRGSATVAALGDDARRLQERNRIWSSAMHGSPGEVGRGLWLSVRRLRHAPKRAHLRALVEGIAGLPGRLFARALGRRHRSTVLFGQAATNATPATTVSPLRRVAGRMRAIGANRVADELRGTPGVNIVGYHHISSGLGFVARELVAALTAAGVPCIAIDNDLSTSPRRRVANPLPDEIFDTTIAVVTAFEFPYFCHRFPQLVGPGTRMIGYWFWELEHVPPEHVEALGLVDELWTPSRFVFDAYRSVASDVAPPVPVRFAPIRMPEPDVDAQRVDAWRSAWGDDFVFVSSFDYLSIVERKHPLGVIAAFRTAFGSDGPEAPPVRLVVKTINGEQRPSDVATIVAAVGGDPRIDLVDEHVDDEGHHALLAAADCLVTLHRSEGLGLHPALAMWLGTPVISTRYAGVIDFVDDHCALMVDAALVPVTGGQGIYPESASWAEPDLEQAAAHMRRIVADPGLRADLTNRARARIESQPTAAEFGRAYAAMLRAPAARTVSDDGGDVFFAGLDVARGRVRGIVRRAWSRLPGRSPSWPDSARR